MNQSRQTSFDSLRAGVCNLLAAPARLLFLALVLLALPAPAFTVRMWFVNPYTGTNYTNAIVATPISTNILASGGVQTTGVPLRLTPGTNGFVTNYLGQGFWALQGTGANQGGVVINVYDNGAQQIDYTNLLYSGFNTYAIVYGSNQPPSSGQITNALGFLPVSPTVLNATNTAILQQVTNLVNGATNNGASVAYVNAALSATNTALTNLILATTNGLSTRLLNTNTALINLIAAYSNATEAHIVAATNFTALTNSFVGRMGTNVLTADAVASLSSGTVSSNTPTISFTNLAAGYQNSISTSGSAPLFNLISGGRFNSIRFTPQYDFIGAGLGNQIGQVASYSTIVGGVSNTTTISSDGMTIGGGGFNTIGDVGSTSINWATIGGGVSNLNSGQYATIPGGLRNITRGRSAVAMGENANANNDNSFVWSDGGTNQSLGTNQFLIFARGGVGIGTNQPGTNAFKVRGNADFDSLTVGGLPVSAGNTNGLASTNYVNAALDAGTNNVTTNLAARIIATNNAIVAAMNLADSQRVGTNQFATNATAVTAALAGKVGNSGGAGTNIQLWGVTQYRGASSNSVHRFDPDGSFSLDSGNVTWTNGLLEINGDVAGTSGRFEQFDVINGGGSALSGGFTAPSGTFTNAFTVKGLTFSNNIADTNYVAAAVAAGSNGVIARIGSSNYVTASVTNGLAPTSMVNSLSNAQAALIAGKVGTNDWVLTNRAKLNATNGTAYSLGVFMDDVSGLNIQGTGSNRLFFYDKNGFAQIASIGQGPIKVNASSTSGLGTEFGTNGDVTTRGNFTILSNLNAQGISTTNITASAVTATNFTGTNYVAKGKLAVTNASEGLELNVAPGKAQLTTTAITLDAINNGRTNTLINDSGNAIFRTDLAAKTLTATNTFALSNNVILSNSTASVAIKGVTTPANANANYARASASHYTNPITGYFYTNNTGTTWTLYSNATALFNISTGATGSLTPISGTGSATANWGADADAANLRILGDLVASSTNLQANFASKADTNLSVLSTAGSNVITAIALTTGAASNVVARADGAATNLYVTNLTAVGAVTVNGSTPITSLDGTFTNTSTFTNGVVGTVGTNIFTPAAITQLAGSGGGGSFNPTNTQFYSPNSTTLTNGGLKITPTNIVTSWSTNGTAVKWWGYTAPISNAALGHFGEFRASSTAQANSFGDGLGDLTYSFGLNYGGDVTGNSSYGVAPTNMPNWTWTRESSYQNGAGQTALEAWESWGSPYTANGTNCQWRWFGADLFWDTTNKTYISSDANFSVGSFSIAGPFNKYNGSTYGFVVSSPSAGSGGMNVMSAGNYRLTTNDVSQTTSLTVETGYGGTIAMKNPTNSQTYFGVTPSATKVQISGASNGSNFNNLVIENYTGVAVNTPTTLSNTLVAGGFTNSVNNPIAQFLSGINVSGQTNTFSSRLYMLSALGMGAGQYITYGENTTTNRYAYTVADGTAQAMTNGAFGGMAFKVQGNSAGGGTLMLSINGSGTGNRIEGSPASSVAVTNAILVAYNGVASYATNTTLTVAATGITNTLTVNYLVAGFTGTSVTQTNASGYGFSRGTITMPTDITLQPGAKLIGTGCAAAGAYAW